MESPRPVPTFYLGGQPYIFQANTISQTPELAEEALFETLRVRVSLFASHVGKMCPPGETEVMTTEQYVSRMCDLSLGSFALRDCIPHRRTLVPNSCLVTIH